MNTSDTDKHGATMLDRPGRSFRGEVNDDLLDERPGNPLLEPYVRRLDVPHPVKVLGLGSQNRRVRRSGCWTPRPLFLETFLQLPRLLQGLIPARLHLSSHQSVLGIQSIVSPW